MAPLTPKRSEDTVTEMTELVLPPHANALGNVFGGQIMAWVDMCGAISAQRHSGRVAVTAFVDDFKFERPVKVGEVVRVRAHVTATFRTSMELRVVATGEHSQTGRHWPCVSALLTYVAIDDEGKPTPVPPLVLDTDHAREAQAAGEQRRRTRLGTQR